MPSPTRGDSHVDAALTQISVAYMQEAKNFAAPAGAPRVPVSFQSDKYYEYSRPDWNRIEAEKRAPGTESVGGGWDLATASYFAEEYAVHKDVHDSIGANEDPVLNQNRDATNYVTQQIMLKREKDYANTFMQTSTWTGSSSGGDITPSTKWDAASSTPIKDIHDQQVAVMEKTGFKPNVLTLGPKVWNALRNNDEILDRIKYTQRGIVSTDLLASLFDVDQVIMPAAIENTAAKGATEASAFIHDNDAALLTYVPAAPSILTPSAAYTFVWQNRPGAGSNGMRIKRFRMEELDSERIEGQLNYDMKIIAPELGAFFTSVLT